MHNWRWGEAADKAQIRSFRRAIAVLAPVKRSRSRLPPSPGQARMGRNASRGGPCGPDPMADTLQPILGGTIFVYIIGRPRSAGGCWLGHSRPRKSSVL